ncbi:MAG: signal peptide peptidase SppA [candidate division WOR-3 bacterium]|nr:signal peptide peptidase SppA [candidate division WOR-3 bacterium]MCR4423582.1 signal peptide peptidase SppA [candidate division WOR-3 bacterium]MDH7518921.1 signal peptide peptidase SppA [bacterium]
MTLITTALLVFFFIAGLKDDSLIGTAPALGYVTIEGTLTDSRETVRQLQNLSKNPAVKGILIRVESPGGGVTAAHEIYQEIKRIRDSGKPVVVSMGTIAASGGYYVAAPATVIVANPGTLTGSIGVIMELPIVRGFLDKLGMKVEVIKSKDAKDIGSPFRDMTDFDRRLLQGVVSDVYQQFLEVVSSERSIPIDSLERIADGRILTGRQAKAWGLVDTLGTLEEAKRILAERCGIKGEPRWIKPRKRIQVWLERMLDDGMARILGVPRYPRLLFQWF